MCFFLPWCFGITVDVDKGETIKHNMSIPKIMVQLMAFKALTYDRTCNDDRDYGETMKSLSFFDILRAIGPLIA